MGSDADSRWDDRPGHLGEESTMSITKKPTLLLVVALVAAGWLTAGDAGEVVLPHDQMAVLFGGVNNGLCCASIPECSPQNAPPSCEDKDPCDGEGSTFNYDYSIYCGKQPTPPDPLANCAQYTNDPLGEPVYCYFKWKCKLDDNGRCDIDLPVLNSRVTGVYGCAQNKVCRDTPPQGP
jgi:hypothetical protein